MRGMYGFGMPHQPVGVVLRRILQITIALFVLEVLLDPGALNPVRVGPLAKWFGLSWHDIRHGMVWQLVSYMFLHGSLMHIVVNMLGVFFLGRELEAQLGPRRFLYLYLGCGALGGVGWLLLSGGSNATCVGASGALFGIIGAFAALFPHQQITILLFFVLPVTASARTLALIFGVASLVMLRVGGGGVAHAAHLAGGLAGYAYGRYLGSGGGGYRGSRSAFGRGRGGSFSNLRAWWRRRRYRVMNGQTTPHDEGPLDWQAVDTVLDKIRTRGIDSLTRQEKSILDRASGKMGRGA